MTPITREQLEKLIQKYDPGACWVNKDETRYSRLFSFDVLGETYFIEWWCNISYLIRENLKVPFVTVNDDGTWPTYYQKQLQFYTDNPRQCVAILGVKRHKEYEKTQTTTK